MRSSAEWKLKVRPGTRVVSESNLLRLSLGTESDTGSQSEERVRQIGIKSGTGIRTENGIAIEIGIKSVIGRYTRRRNSFYVHAGGAAGES
ncbi:hypothetical protein EVAR_96783_1 [Eumeta japonica]|uniref:Uncharacterized protein n=1 Tax=Eumeta variegata TaxID=151549 RepID=A0A4C1WQV4_EUMVA|nr:hypothetical protein EVAR_96783_1 [Eumeta japonica]